jgi:hypothetical protein
LLVAAAFMAVVVGVAEGQTPSLTITAGEVEFNGPTEVKSVSNIQDIGQGSVQIRDKDLKTAVLIGTSTGAAAGPGQRIQPIEGTGVGITSKADTGGVFVSAGLGQVGVNDASGAYKGDLHVNGALRSERIVASFSGAEGSAMMLDAVHHNTILLGTPDVPKLKYAIGRGQVVDRTMTVTVPSLTEYDGAGKAPMMMYQSPNKVLAAVRAESGEVFVSGNLGVGAVAETTAWKSGSASNLHVSGQVRFEERTGGSAEATALYYRSSGKTPAISIRTGSPATATAVDTRFFITGGKDAVTVGINTRTPKTRLDVHGHLHMQGPGNEGSGIYFPSSAQGKAAGFFIRGSDSPTTSTAATDTRFYLNPAGGAAINTVESKYGLSIHAKGTTENGADLSIPKGSLHLKDGIRDLDGHHKLTLDDENIMKALNVEGALTIGSETAYQGSDKLVHVKGDIRPQLLISHTAGKPVSLLLQAGADAWTLEGTSSNLNFASSKAAQEKVYMTKTGSFVVGTNPPKYGLQIETAKAELTDKANDIYVAKGNIRVKYGILQLSTYKGKAITWGIVPSLFTNLKDISVDDKIAIGTAKKTPFSLFVEKGRSVNVGDTGFIYTTGDEGTLSFNEHVVTTGGYSQKKLHDKTAFAAALRLGNNGKVGFHGTAAEGTLTMSKLMTFDAPNAQAIFEKYADFGMSSTGAKFPLRVKGGSAASQAAIAFGHLGNNMGLLGSTSNMVFLATKDEKKFIAVQHQDGFVGIGTTTPSETLTIKSTTAQADIHFTSSKAPAKVALVTMEAGGSTKLFASAGDSSSGKFEVNGFTELEFSNAGGSATTNFDRGNKPAGSNVEFQAPHVEFRTGKVGLGVDAPTKELDINGDHWSQGQLFLTKGFARSHDEAAAFTEMIQLDEGSGPHEQTKQSSFNVPDAVKALARLVRRNKDRLQKQASVIAKMESTLARFA